MFTNDINLFKTVSIAEQLVFDFFKMVDCLKILSLGIQDHSWIVLLLVGGAFYFAFKRKLYIAIAFLAVVCFSLNALRFYLFGAVIYLDLIMLGLFFIALWFPDSIYKKRFLLICGCTLFIIYASPLGRTLLYHLEHHVVCQKDISDNAAGLILLGGYFNLREKELNGRPMFNLAGGRLLEFIILAKRYEKLPILITGNPYEADMTLKVLNEAGIDPSRIRVDPKAKNTIENSKNSLDLVSEEEKKQPWVLVTSAFHMPRSLGLFLGHGWNVIPYSVDYHTSEISFWKRWMMSLDRCNALCFQISIKEWAGLINNYIVNGSKSLLP